MGQKLNVYSEFACLCGYLLNDYVLYSSGVTQSIELLYKDAITELHVCQNRKFHQTKVSPNGHKLNQGKDYDVTSLLLVVGMGIAKSAMVVQNIRLDGVMEGRGGGRGGGQGPGPPPPPPYSNNHTTYHLYILF